MAAPVMTTPPQMAALGATRDDNHVYGFNSGERIYYPIPSVTTVIKVVDKSEPIIAWAKREVAKAAVTKLDVVAEMVRTGGEQAAIDWLKTIPGYMRDASADLGSHVHTLAEQINRGQTPAIPAIEVPFVESYFAWTKRAKPRWLAAEEMVFDLEHDYAGTLDAIGVIAGDVWCLDIKTGSGIYPETSLQLAAYAKAKFIGRKDTSRRFRIPKATRYGVIHVRPEGTRLVEYMAKPGQVDAAYLAFLTARRLYEFMRTEMKTVMGDAISFTEGVAA